MIESLIARVVVDGVAVPLAPVAERAVGAALIADGKAAARTEVLLAAACQPVLVLLAAPLLPGAPRGRRRRRRWVADERDISARCHRPALLRGRPCSREARWRCEGGLLDAVLVGEGVAAQNQAAVRQSLNAHAVHDALWSRLDGRTGRDSPPAPTGAGIGAVAILISGRGTLLAHEAQIILIAC